MQPLALPWSWAALALFSFLLNFVLPPLILWLAHRYLAGVLAAFPLPEIK